MDTEYRTKTGWLCLDFANTVGWHASDSPEESLNKYTDLVEWSARTGIISGDAKDALLRKSEEEPVEAQAVLENAKEVREDIYRILSDTAHGHPIKITDLKGFNKALASMLSHSRLAPYEGGFRWDWDSRPDKLDSVIWPVVKSAVDLMTSEAIKRVGQCADEKGCGWLFWDTSRNRSRRWCAMSDCGNRAKVRRFYAKKK
ncbi:MAG TPA: ABATE domain-containing protein [Syntrophales bacterium]|nr:ABATE domain-containing protein [Syntrophales bacterium]